MATLVETLGAQANPTVDIAGSLGEGIKTGIQLATAKEQVEQKKTQTEAMKEQLAQAKFQSFDSMMKTLNRASNPAIAKQLAKGMKNRFQQMGFDPAIIDITVSDPNFGRVYQNISDAMSGKIQNNPQSLAQALQSFQDAGMFAEGMTTLENSLKRSQEEKKMSQQNSQFYASLNAQKEKIPGGGLTKGEQMRDTQFAKKYSEFFDAGGAATIEANLASLQDSIDTLEAGNTTQAEGFVPDKVGDVVFPKTANVRTNVTGVLIQGLKDTFGGQLSDGERKAMVESAYVSSADPKDNAKRVKALAEKIKEGARAKQAAGEYFEQNGTLKGFKGTSSFNIGGKKVNFDPGGEGESAGISPENIELTPQEIQSANKTPNPAAAIEALKKAKQSKQARK